MKVQCFSIGNCAALGNTYWQGGSAPFFVKESSGVWGSPVVIPGFDAGQGLTLACSNSENCVMGGTYQSNAIVDAEVNGVWGTAQQINSTDGSTPTTIASATCPSIGHCTVGGSGYLPGTGTIAFVAEFTNGGWGNTLDLSTNLLNAPYYGSTSTPVTNSAKVVVVNCPSVGNCYAGGTYSTGLHYQSSGDVNYEFLATETNGVWSQAVDFGPHGSMVGSIQYIECERFTSCTIAGQIGTPAGYTSAYTGFVTSLTDGVWSTPVLPVNVVSFQSFSCSSVGNCVASADGSLLLETAGVWGSPQDISQPLGTSKGLIAAGCGPDGSCAAVGDIGSGSQQAAFGIAMNVNTPSVPTLIAQATSRGGATTTFSWSPPASNGNSSIIGYSVQTSSDGQTWKTSSITGTSYPINFTTPGTAVNFRVAGVNALGVGTYSSISTATAPGLAPQVVQVLSADRQPVTGGAITWSATNVKSAVTYGLTANGQIRFPSAPAGIATVTLTNGVMPDGSSVSGTYKVVLGFALSVINLPAEPSAAGSTVNVTTPGGLGVPGATVSVQPISQSATVNGTTFSVQQLISSGRTDATGIFVATGYISTHSQATVSYNDSVITQTATSTVAGPTTTIELPYEPVVEPTATQVITTANSMVSVTLKATAPAFANARRAHTFQSGVKVSAVLPPGFKSCSGQSLSGTTNSIGRVTLKFCATLTGVVSFKAVGAYAIGSYRVYVVGSSPTVVLSPKASTPALGVAKISWLKPAWTGGAPVLKYVVTLSSTGKPNLVSTVANPLVTISGLSHATRYKASIMAFTKFGASPAASVNVSVA